jgi:hypothetical protein
LRLRQSFLYGRRLLGVCRRTCLATHAFLAAYPEVMPDRTDPPRRLLDALLPVWPCSWWGLPSQVGHPTCWCALTAPFHPYRTRQVNSEICSPLTWRARRFAFCCTIPSLAAGGCYPPPCPAEPGLSSRRRSMWPDRTMIGRGQACAPASHAIVPSSTGDHPVHYRTNEFYDTDRRGVRQVRGAQ